MLTNVIQLIARMHNDKQALAVRAGSLVQTVLMQIGRMGSLPRAAAPSCARGRLGRGPARGVPPAAKASGAAPGLPPGSTALGTLRRHT